MWKEARNCEPNPSRGERRSTGRLGFLHVERISDTLVSYYAASARERVCEMFHPPNPGPNGPEIPTKRRFWRRGERAARRTRNGRLVPAYVPESGITEVGGASTGQTQM